MSPLSSLHAPLLPLAVALAAGIALGTALPAFPSAVLLAVAVVLTLLAGRWPLVQSVGLCVCVLLLGMLIAPGEEERLPDGVWTEAVVASTPSERPKTLMTELLLPATGEQRRCYIWKDERSRQIAVGQALTVCLRDGQFIARDGWHLGGDGFNQLSHWQRLRIKAMKIRGVLAERLHLLDSNDQAEAVLAAMVLGDKSALTREQRDTYSVSGASHVLALSGLHLSIIYLLLTRLTLGRRRFWLMQVLMVLAIWAFALLTGLSTSIVRAAVMLTIYALFTLGKRHHAPLGVLSFTAIVMLLISPRSLFDVGFQLSFAAMLGILLLTPLFERWVSPAWMMSHRPVKWLYGLVAVSIAAQIGTAPLVAYYFGRFSTWFLLTNIVVLPLAALILYAALTALVFPTLVGIGLWLTRAMNTILGWIQSLPFSSIDGLHPTMLQVTMYYVVVIAAGCTAWLWCSSRSRTDHTS